jgi:hypothetical protein
MELYKPRFRDSTEVVHRTASPLKSRPASCYYAAALDALCVTAAGPSGSQSDSGSLCTARIRSKTNVFIFIRTLVHGWLAHRGEVS